MSRTVVMSCQGLYGGVVMSRTVWGCGHVKDCMPLNSNLCFPIK